MPNSVRRFVPPLAAGLFAVTAAAAQTPVRFSLDWRWEGPAAPFAVALDKGYFKAEGLDVTIEPGGLPRADPARRLRRLRHGLRRRELPDPLPRREPGPTSRP